MIRLDDNGFRTVVPTYPVKMTKGGCKARSTGLCFQALVFPVFNIIAAFHDNWVDQFSTSGTYAAEDDLWFLMATKPMNGCDFNKSIRPRAIHIAPPGPPGANPPWSFFRIHNPHPGNGLPVP